MAAQAPSPSPTSDAAPEDGYAQTMWQELASDLAGALASKPTEPASCNLSGTCGEEGEEAAAQRDHPTPRGRAVAVAPRKRKPPRRKSDPPCEANEDASAANTPGPLDGTGCARQAVVKESAREEWAPLPPSAQRLVEMLDRVSVLVAFYSLQRLQVRVACL